MCALHGYTPAKTKKTQLQEQLTKAGYKPEAVALTAEFLMGGQM